MSTIGIQANVTRTVCNFPFCTSPLIPSYTAILQHKNTCAGIKHLKGHSSVMFLLIVLYPTENVGWLSESAPRVLKSADK